VALSLLRRQLSGPAELSQMFRHYVVGVRERTFLYSNVAHRPGRPRLLSPKLRTAGSCRCAGLEGWQFPKRSAKGAASSRSSGKPVEASRGRQLPAPSLVSPMAHLVFCAVGKQERLAGAKVAASAVDGATPSNDHFSVTLNFWTKSVSRISC
jgi:hypothetical protein